MSELPPRELTCLVDYRRFFYGSAANRVWSFDLERLTAEFLKWNIRAEVLEYPQVDIRDPRWRGRVVLYQSSEDPDLRYKGYVEDVLWGLQLAGARLIPRLEFCHAHHNKVFMEFLRDLSPLEGLHTIHSRAFGTFEDALKALPQLPTPSVVKGASSACSAQVALARNPRELRRLLERFTRSAPWWRRVRRVIACRLCLWARIERPPRESLHRNRVIVQNLIPGLQCDYKVLIYGERYYVVRRRVRPNDFRASGSGLLDWPDEAPEAMLAFAEQIVGYFGAPLLSLDIAEEGGRLHLLEFQFVLFGNLTLEGSRHWFVRRGSAWERHEGPSVVETEFARSMARHLAAEAAAAG